MKNREPLDQFFWTKVNKQPGGCWLWTAGQDRQGYGQFTDANKRNVRAHRFAYELKYGPIAPGLLACHACDVPSCVNPDHIFLGTAKENTHDGLRKGRITRLYAAKLTEQQVEMIKSLLRSGGRPKDIGPMFGVTRQAISMIRNGKHWDKARYVDIG